MGGLIRNTLPCRPPCGGCAVRSGTFGGVCLLAAYLTRRLRSGGGHAYLPHTSLPVWQQEASQGWDGPPLPPPRKSPPLPIPSRTLPMSTPWSFMRSNTSATSAFAGSCRHGMGTKACASRLWLPFTTPSQSSLSFLCCSACERSTTEFSEEPACRPAKGRLHHSMHEADDQAKSLWRVSTPCLCTPVLHQLNAEHEASAPHVAYDVMLAL